MSMITIQYKCLCMVNEVDLTIRERLPDEDVRHYVGEYLGLMISADHQTRSPLCTQTIMEYCKIPVDDDKPIGVKPHQQNN